MTSVHESHSAASLLTLIKESEKMAIDTESPIDIGSKNINVPRIEYKLENTAKILSPMTPDPLIPASREAPHMTCHPIYQQSCFTCDLPLTMYAFLRKKFQILNFALGNSRFLSVICVITNFISVRLFQIFTLFKFLYLECTVNFYTIPYEILPGDDMYEYTCVTCTHSSEDTLFRYKLSW